MSTVYAIGDIHGSLDAYVSLLNIAGLADQSGRWTGGDATLVQTGDLIDRGPCSLASLRLTKSLQEQAICHGGQVLFFLGGHEVYALAAADGNDWALLNWLTAQNGGHSTILEWLHDNQISTPTDDQEVGILYTRFLRQFSAGDLGSWLREGPTAGVAGDCVFVHAGISCEVPGKADVLNQQALLSLANLKTYMATADPVLGRRGPYWVRDLTHREVRRSLDDNDARRLVAGHNPGPSIMSKYDGDMLVIDTNVARGGMPQCLVIDGAEANVLELDGRSGPVECTVAKQFMSARRYAAVSAVGRFGRGDVVLFYSSHLTGGRALLKVLEVWSTGGEVFYAGSLMAYLPDRRNGCVRYNCNETWTFSGAFVDAVSVPLSDVRHQMPPELVKASEILS